MSQNGENNDIAFNGGRIGNPRYFDRYDAMAFDLKWPLTILGLDQ